MDVKIKRCIKTALREYGREWVGKSEAKKSPVNNGRAHLVMNCVLFLLRFGPVLAAPQVNLAVAYLKCIFKPCLIIYESRMSFF